MTNQKLIENCYIAMFRRKSYEIKQEHLMKHVCIINTRYWENGARKRITNENFH